MRLPHNPHGERFELGDRQGFRCTSDAFLFAVAADLSLGVMDNEISPFNSLEELHAELTKIDGECEALG